MDGHVARMGVKRNAGKTLFCENLKDRDLLEAKGNIKL
jgi:hypothetical protein